ncbi:hypothetical protein G6F58_013718 [Rhizopus delemar]|nr:hypothetical protein G6F58_013718 [Rhizopus delemar]
MVFAPKNFLGVPQADDKAVLSYPATQNRGTENNMTVFDGKGVRGYGAYAFRTDDKAFADAFNAELAKYIGTDEHKKLVAPFGFTSEELPQGVTAAKLCAGQ